MDCRECQRKVPLFLEDSLELDDLGGFIHHIRGCGDCYEELEIMFMISRALKELEAGKEGSYNFQELLDKKLSSVEYYVEHMMSFRRARRIILLVMNTTVLVGMLLQILLWTA
jgi:hypothetical protein